MSDTCYDPAIDEQIFKILDKVNETTFTELFKILSENKKVSSKTTLSKHLKFLTNTNYNQNILIWKRDLLEGQNKIREGSIKLHPLTKEKRRLNLFTIDYSDKKGICKEWKDLHKIKKFTDLNETEKKKIACQLLLSYIGQGSYLTIPTDSPKAGDHVLYNNITKKPEYFTGKRLRGFRISELIDRKRKISSIEDINEYYQNLGPEMKNCIYTDRYIQLAHPKNRFLHLQLSREEIEECIKLLEDKKHPIIRKSGLFNGEILYDIENGDKKVSGIDNNEEITNTTFIISCDYIFDLVFNRMRLIWMFKGRRKPDDKYVDWFKYIYGNEMTIDFFLHKKEQRQEYENRIKEHFQGYLNKPSLTVVEREKFIKQKINEIIDNRIKDYDISIKRNIVDGLEKKYGNKVKMHNKIFYNLMLEIICPSFLRKEYSILDNNE